jgi:molybdopterin synthase sulfur carrier subunit
MATVWIPSLLRDITGGGEQVSVVGSTVGEVIAALDQAHPGIAERLCEGDRIRSSMQVLVDGRLAQLGFAEPVRETSEVHFVPAVSGG